MSQCGKVGRKMRKDPSALPTSQVISAMFEVLYQLPKWLAPVWRGSPSGTQWGYDGDSCLINFDFSNLQTYSI